nr:ankyrin repeat domain-containing protein [Corynebacterium lactis]
MAINRQVCSVAAAVLVAAVSATVLVACSDNLDEQRKAGEAAASSAAREAVSEEPATGDEAAEGASQGTVTTGASASEKRGAGVNLPAKTKRAVERARAHAEEHGYDIVVEVLDGALTANPASATAEKAASGATGVQAANKALLADAKEGDVRGAAGALIAGANVDAADDFARTPLLWAVTKDHIEVAELLLSFGANVNAVDGQQDTPWLVTGVTGSPDMGELLLDYDVDFRLYNRYGGTPIIPASERGHFAYVNAMVDHPKITVDYLNHVNKIGWTAMLEAVILGDGSEVYQEIVRTLVRAGADPNIADADGKTPLEHARANGYKEIVAILKPVTR